MKLKYAPPEKEKNEWFWAYMYDGSFFPYNSRFPSEEIKNIRFCFALFQASHIQRKIAHQKNLSVMPSLVHSNINKANW